MREKYALHDGSSTLIRSGAAYHQTGTFNWSQQRLDMEVETDKLHEWDKPV